MIQLLENTSNRFSAFNAY